MTSSPDARMEHLTRFLFTAPPWYVSLLLAFVPGLLADLLAHPVPGVPWAGALLLSLPAAAAFLLEFRRLRGASSRRAPSTA